MCGREGQGGVGTPSRVRLIRLAARRCHRCENANYDLFSYLHSAPRRAPARRVAPRGPDRTPSPVRCDCERPRVRHGSRHRDPASRNAQATPHPAPPRTHQHRPPDGVCLTRRPPPPLAEYRPSVQRRPTPHAARTSAGRHGPAPQPGPRAPCSLAPSRAFPSVTRRPAPAPWHWLARPPRPRGARHRARCRVFAARAEAPRCGLARLARRHLACPAIQAAGAKKLRLREALGALSPSGDE